MRKFGDKIKIIVRWISIKIRQLTDFLTVGIWNLDPSATSKRKARLIRDGKVLILMQQTFSSQKIGFQSTALSYRTIMSLVPFLAIAFYVTARVGLSDQLSAFLYANTSDERLIRSLMKAADNILDTAQSGLFGFISMFSFFWIVIGMMLSVRQVFNNVWKVEKERNFQRHYRFGKVFPRMGNIRSRCYRYHLNDVQMDTGNEGLLPACTEGRFFFRSDIYSFTIPIS